MPVRQINRRNKIIRDYKPSEEFRDYVTEESKVLSSKAREILYSMEKNTRCRCYFSDDDGWEHYQFNECGRCKTIQEKYDKLSFRDKVAYFFGL
ncbi:MAG: hypothetical protein WCG45_03580 [bacterium]